MLNIIIGFVNSVTINPLFLDPHLEGLLLVLVWVLVQSYMFAHIQLYYGANLTSSEILNLVLFIGVFFLGGCMFTGLCFSSLTDHIYASEVILNHNEVTETAVPEREISVDGSNQKNQSNVKPVRSLHYSIGIAIVMLTIYLLMGDLPII